MANYYKSEFIECGYPYWRLTMFMGDEGREYYIRLSIDNTKKSPDRGEVLDTIYTNMDAGVLTAITKDKSKIDRIETLMLDEMYTFLQEEVLRCECEKIWYERKEKSINELLKMKMFRKKRIGNILEE